MLMRIIRGTGLARMQERIRLANTRPFDEKPSLSAETRAHLVRYFRDDIEQLEKMTGRDLRAWLQGA